MNTNKTIRTASGIIPPSFTMNILGYEPSITQRYELFY